MLSCIRTFRFTKLCKPTSSLHLGLFSRGCLRWSVKKTPSSVLRKLSALMTSAGVVVTLLVSEFEELTSRFYPF